MKYNLNKDWDKTFPKSNKVETHKVSFTNRFGIKLVGDVYIPKNHTGKLIGIAVCGPFGAVKEQCSGLYAQTMAEKGFYTLAFDPSYTGESSGYPRYVHSPDINTEDFQAAVDFLSNQEEVNPDKICIIGICGWGGLALNTASIDTRIKVTISSTMYNMSRVSHYGYFDQTDENQLYEIKKALNKQRSEDFKNGICALAGGLPDSIPEDAPFYVKDYFDYYKTDRGYHPRSLNSNGGWATTASISLINTPQHTFLSEIRNAVLVIHGEKAHSCYMSKDAFNKLKGENKELLIIPNAVHTDLYDKMDVIPFEKMKDFILANTNE